MTMTVSLVITGACVAVSAWFVVQEHYMKKGLAEWRAAHKRSMDALKRDETIPFPPDPPIVFLGNQRRLWNEWRAKDAARRLRE